MKRLLTIIQLAYAGIVIPAGVLFIFWGLKLEAPVAVVNGVFCVMMGVGFPLWWERYKR